MRTKKISWLLLLLSLAACNDEDKANQRETWEGPAGAPRSTARQNAFRSHATGSEVFRDAVGPAAPGVDRGRPLFDGGRVLKEDAEAGAVYAGAGGSGIPKAAYTSEGRKDTLKINEPPSPYNTNPNGGGNAGLPIKDGESRSGNPGTGVALKAADEGKTAPDAMPANSGGSASGSKKPRFLLIGDSQTAGYFGRGLDEYLRRDYPSALVETYGQGGSNAGWFVPGNVHAGYATWNSFFHYYKDNDPAKLTKSIMQTQGKFRKTPLITSAMKPDTSVVLVALGSNHLNWTAAGKAIWNDKPIKELAQAVKAHGARCVWISPADMKGPMVPVDPKKPDGPKKRKLTPDQMKAHLKAADAEIKAQINGLCDYIDVRLPYEGGDGIHLGETRGHEVAEAVLKEIKKLVP